MKKILLVRKMSSLDFHYNGNHTDPELVASHNEQLANLKKIQSEILRLGANYKVVTREQLKDENYEDYDFIFSAGGDGTAIATASFNESTPQLNLKTDKRSRGNLCAKTLEQSIEETILGKFAIREWTREDVYLDGKFIARASNETCIGEDMRFDRMAKYDITWRSDINVYKERQENSGLIIATGLGSGGWPAAFEPFDKQAKYFKFNALLPMAGQASGQGDYFNIGYKRHNGMFSLDTIAYKFPMNSVLEIQPSNKPLKIIIPEGDLK